MSDLSKIQMPDNTIYEIKDEYSRYIINVLLGIEEEDNKDKLK